MLALSLLLAVASPVAADDEESDGSSLDSAAEPAIGFMGFLGLSGFQKMVDGRTPRGLINMRGGARYDFMTRTIDITGNTNGAKVSTERHEFSVYGGATAFSFVEASLRMPYVLEDIDFDFDVGPNSSEKNQGWADMDLAGKVTLSLGPFDLAGYATGKVPTAEPDIKDLLEYQYGIAGTFSILNEHLSVHGNIGGIHEDHGLNGLVYRVGGAFVVWADHNAVVRLYGYADGVEWEGNAGTDFKVDFGVQALVLDIITLEIGSSVRLLNADKLGEGVQDELTLRGALDDHFDDEGTWAVTVAAGILF